MTQFYKIDTKFYFSLIIFYKKVFSLGNKELIQKIHNNSHSNLIKLNLNENCLDDRKINKQKLDRLANTVGYALLKKDFQRYYANLFDVYQLIINYRFLLKELNKNNINLNIKDVVLENLNSFKNKDKEYIFENYFNNFNSVLIPKEEKNIKWFLFHKNKKLKKV